MASYRLIEQLPRWLPHAAWAVVAIVGAWLFAGWLWAALAPTVFVAPVVIPAETLSAAAAVADRHWFGGTGDGSPVERRESRFRLIGAMTGHGGLPGFAVIGEDGKPALPVVEGEEFAPGVRLQRVLPRAVELQRQGRSERLELNDESTGGST
jgi:hypothetical protein